MKSDRQLPGPDRRVQLMATCLCDAFYDDVARATVEVLESVGCVVEFPEAQTCCGQPAFNGGDWVASRRVVRHTLDAFAGEVPIVIPSGSCAAMMRHGAPLEFEAEADRARVAGAAQRTWELADFLVTALGITRWTGRYPAKVALHRSCHTRGSNTAAAVLQLLQSIDGIEVVPFGEAEQCCGFGGTFAVTFPHISKQMGTLKLDHVLEAKPDVLVSADMSCLMHLAGLAEKRGQPIKALHFAQVLRDAAATSQGGLG
jgi:L-lactate dehydrogenase complex protein LldE